MVYFDYYKIINNNNYKYTIKQPSRFATPSTESYFAVIRNKIYKEINDLIQKHTNIPEFNQILKYRHLNEHDQMVTQILLEIDTIYKYTNEMDLIKHFILYGHKLPFMISVELNPYNPLESVFAINDNFLSLYPNLYSNKKILYNYKCLLNNIFNMVFGPNHAFDIMQIINIEKKLVSYQLNEKEISDSIKDLKLYSISEIKNIGLDLPYIFTNVGSGRVDLPNYKILTPNLNGIRLTLAYIKKNWNHPDWKIYWIYQIIITYFKCVPNLIKLINDFNYVNLNGDIKPKLLYLTQWIPYKLNYYYYKYYKNTKEIEFCTKLANKYIKAFINKITQNT